MDAYENLSIIEFNIHFLRVIPSKIQIVIHTNLKSNIL
jgi:hypothetical protein